MYPLDFLRTRLAVDPGNKGEKKFNGIIDCVKKIYASDGPIGFYRGFLINLPTLMFYRGFYFGFYDTAKANFTKDTYMMTKVSVAAICTSLAGCFVYP